MGKQHGTTQMKKLIKKLESLGFVVEKNKNGTYSISPPDHINGPVYKTHGTIRALHPMRRDFKRLYNVNIGDNSEQ